METGKVGEGRGGAGGRLGGARRAEMGWRVAMRRERDEARERMQRRMLEAGIYEDWSRRGELARGFDLGYAEAREEAKKVGRGKNRRKTGTRGGGVG